MSEIVLTAILFILAIAAVGASNAFLAHTIIKTMQKEPVIGKGEMEVFESVPDRDEINTEANGWLPQDQHYV